MSSQGEVDHPNQKIQDLTAQLEAARGELKKQAFCIREYEAMLNSLIKNDADPLIVIDNHYKILKYNSEAEKLFVASNYESSPSLKTGCLYPLAGDSMPELKEAFSGKYFQKEKTIPNANGSNQNFLVNYMAVTFEAETVSAVIITFRDLDKNNLKERLKEHSCRIQIAELCNTDIEIGELLTKAVDIIPGGWQFPEIASAHLQYDGMTFSSLNHQTSPWFQSLNIVTADKKELRITVFYHHEMPTADHGPFLKEEKELLKIILGYLVSRINQIVEKEAVQLREQHLNSIWNNEPQCVKIMGLEGNLMDMNPSGLRMIEAEDIPNEVLGSQVVNLVHPEDKNVFLNLHINALKGKKGEAQFRVTGLKGTQRWMESTAVPLRAKKGNINAVLSVTNDITEKKVLQQLLENANQLARIGGWEIDLLKKSIYWSQITREIHEVGSDFVPDLETGINFYKPEVRDRVIQFINKCTESNTPFDFELPIITAKGKEKWVRCIGKGEFRDGLCVRVTGSIQDVHERIETELRLKNTSDNLPGAIFQYHLAADGTDKMLLVSEGAHQIWGLSPAACMEDISKVWAQIDATGDLQKVKDSIHYSANTLSQWYCQWQNLLPDGRIRWHEGHGKPRKTHDGTVIWDSMVLDITDKKELQNLLQRASKLAKIGSWELDLSIMGNDDMYWSPMTRNILGVDENYNPTLTGGFEFYEPGSRQKIREAVNQLRQSGKDFDLELLITTTHGISKWIRCIGHSDWIDGRCVKIYGSFQDIQDRKVTELALEKSNKKLSATLDSIQDGFYAVDRDWKVTYWNKEAERLLKRKRDEILGKNLWEEFKEAVPRKFYSEYSKALEENKPARFEEYFPPLQSWFDVSVYPSEEGLTVYFKDITTKKKAELELKRFREIIENSQDGIAMADHKGRSLYINPGFALMLGQTAESINEAGGPLACYADKSVAKQVFSTLLKGKHWRGDVKLLNRSGEAIDFFLSGGPVFNEHHELIAIYGIHTDISERKKAEQELERAYHEKATILESIGDAFFALDHQWVVTYWNKEAEKVLGMERHKVLGKNLWQVYADAVDLEFYTQYHKAMDSGTSVTFEEYYPALTKWFEVTAYPSEKGLSVYFKDVSIRKTAEQKIKESNERFEKAAEATHDAIWDWDIANNTLYWGNGFQTLFGHDLQSITPSIEFWASLIHPDDHPLVMEDLEKVLNKRSFDNFHKEYQFRKRNGEYAYVIDKGIVIRDKNGEAIRMVGAMADITHRKEYEASLKTLNEELEQRAEELAISNAELEQFAFVASHDLQEPLRMITSFLSLLKQNYGDLLDENAQKYIHYAVDGATRMRQIILDLLEFSRVGKQKDKLQHVEIREIIEETCNIQKGLISEKNAVIHCDHLPKVISYRTPLSQVFHNLIGNALKYSRKGIPPEIKITAKEGGDYWLVAVQDNGIGIDKEYFNKIFVIFQRLHGKGEYEGTGIGLAIVKKTIENMGGKIWVDSELGNGSTFYFTIKKVMGKYN